MNDYEKLAAKKKKVEALASSTGKQIWETQALTEFFKSVKVEIDREIKKAKKSGIDLSITNSSSEIGLYTSSDQKQICKITLEYKDVGSGTLEHRLEAVIPGGSLCYTLVDDDFGYNTNALPSEIANKIVFGAIRGRFD
jgi:hypothetical protein